MFRKGNKKTCAFLFLFLCAINCNGASTTRPVVIEVFTASWCSYCFTAGHVIEQVINNYPDVVVIEYHMNDGLCENQIIDKSAVEYANARIGVYFDFFYYVPCAILNGLEEQCPELDTSYDEMAEAINRLSIEMAEKQYLGLKLNGSLGSEQSELRAEINAPNGYPNPVRFIFLLLQDNIAFNAENGLKGYNCVVREFIAEETITFDSITELEIVKTTSSVIDPEILKDVRPVVYIQDTLTKEILMAVDEFTNLSSVSIWDLFQ